LTRQKVHAVVFVALVGTTGEYGSSLLSSPRLYPLRRVGVPSRLRGNVHRTAHPIMEDAARAVGGHDEVAADLAHIDVT
jgi:hypothetical protein